MAELKTRATRSSAAAFLAAVPDPAQRKDARQLHAMMRRASGAPAVMWGPSIVGYGQCQLHYPNGRVLDWFPVGFSPRKGQLVLYLQGALTEHGALVKRLGKVKTGKGCLYLKRLEDADAGALEALIRASATGGAGSQRAGRAKPGAKAPDRRAAKGPTRRR